MHRNPLLSLKLSSKMIFQKNRLMEWQDTEGGKHVERLIWCAPDGHSLFFIPVLGTRAWPFLRTKEEVLSRENDGTTRILEPKDWSDELKRHLDVRIVLTVAEKEYQNRAWAAIKD